MFVSVGLAYMGILKMWKALLPSFAFIFTVSASADLKLTDPGKVCSLLSDLGLKGRKWTQYDDGTSGCASDYKDIGSGAPLPNNLAFYASGVGGAANDVKLVLNYNQPGSVTASAAATKSLIAASEKMAQRALGGKLPKSVTSAIDWGRSTSELVGSGTIEVFRDDWPSGKGYEVHVIMH